MLAATWPPTQSVRAARAARSQTRQQLRESRPAGSTRPVVHWTHAADLCRGHLTLYATSFGMRSRHGTVAVVKTGSTASGLRSIGAPSMTGTDAPTGRLRGRARRTNQYPARRHRAGGEIRAIRTRLRIHSVTGSTCSKSTPRPRS